MLRHIPTVLVLCWSMTGCHSPSGGISRGAASGAAVSMFMEPWKLGSLAPGGTPEQAYEAMNRTRGASRSIGLFFALYLPNRIIDILEILRFGVAVGPAAGLDLRATRYAQLAAGVYCDAGLAWNGRRRSPFRHPREVTTYAAIGPHRGGSGLPSWPLTSWETRVEAGLGLASVTAAVDFAEIVDMLTGWFGLDLLKDDWGYVGPDFSEPTPDSLPSVLP